MLSVRQVTGAGDQRRSLQFLAQNLDSTHLAGVNTWNGCL